MKKSYTFSSNKLQSYFEFKFTFLSLLDKRVWREYKKKQILCFQRNKIHQHTVHERRAVEKLKSLCVQCMDVDSKAFAAEWKVGMVKIEHDPIIKMKMSGTCALRII